MMWIYKYIGKPWSRDGAGPDSYNCWNLVRAVYLERFGKRLPDFENDSEMLGGTARKFASESVALEKQTNWDRVIVPAEGDAVLLGRANRPCHVGIWIGPSPPGIGYILHSIQPSLSAKGGGVCAQTLSSLKCHGWGFVEFYRYKEKE